MNSENIHPNWNVIITARKDGFRETKRALRRFGNIEPTHFFNVLIEHVEDIEDFLHDFSLEYSTKPYLQDAVSCVRPLRHTFVFNSREDFAKKVIDIVTPWISQIAGKSFHVRMNRRGVHEFSALTEEQFLDHFIMESLKSQSHSGKVSFDDPDFIIDVETIDRECGISIWTREELLRHPFLNIH